MEKLTPQEKLEVATGVTIGLIGAGIIIGTRYLRKRAFNRRVAAMVAAQMPEVDAYVARLKAHLDGKLDEHRQQMRDIVDRVERIPCVSDPSGPSEACP